jgi:hypothetical protein
MGWLVLCCVCLLPIAVIALVAPFFDRLPMLILFPLIFGLIVAAILGVMKIAIAKGRRRR